MAFTPPTLAQMRTRVLPRVGRFLADVGIYAPASGGAIPVIDEGIARGVLAIGLAMMDPTAPADADLANLTPYSTLRVEDEAAYWSLAQVDLNWYRALQKHMEPVAANPMAGGWLIEERKSLKAEIARLRAICDDPYREPSDPVVIVSPGFSPFPSRLPSSPATPAAPTDALYLADEAVYPWPWYDGGGLP